MKRAIVASLLLCGLILLGGAIRPDRDPGLAQSGGPGFRGGNTQVDTFRIWSHSTTFPNTAAKTASYIYTDTTRYTTINRGTGAIRWCWVSKSSAAESVTIQASTSANSDYLMWTRTCGNTLEINYTWNADQRLAFIWVNANGLQNYTKIENAYLMFNVAAGTNLIVASSSYVSARLDTISKDYRITAETTSGVHGSNNDAARMNATWTEVNNTANNTWDPILSARLDYNDFGPRSNDVIGPGTYTPGTCLRLNVTDAVQQAADNGTLGRGLLFVITASSASASTNYMDIAAGNHPTFVATAKGCPTFTAVSTSRRGTRPWNGARVPISLQFDDSYVVHSGIYRALSDSGLTFGAAACSTNNRDFTDANGYVHTDMLDSLWAIAPQNLYLMNHSLSHSSLGALTAGQLSANMARTWFTRFSGLDTTQVMDYSLPGGAGVDINLAVVEGLIANGYRSMRSGGFVWSGDDVATAKMGAGFKHDPLLSWDGYVSKYQIASLPADRIFGWTGGASGSAAAAADTVQMKETLKDYVDLYYTQYGKAAMVIYGHFYNPAGATTPSWVNGARIRSFIGMTRQMNSCEIMPHSSIIAMRLNGATAKTPAQVYAANGGATFDALKIKNMAADQDSIYQLGGHNSLLNVWIGPK
jgi:hypothetical protein